ncbi:putative flippase AglR [uncultured archaeon]|nr:putative flippase AglR [uncultured archaeon]
MAKKLNKKELDKSLLLIFQSSIFISIGIIFSKIFAYFYRVIIARYFGPEVYGVFSLSIMILSWVTALATLGLIEGLLRFVPVYHGKKDMNRMRYIIKVVAVFLFFSSIVAAVLLYSLSGFISSEIFHNPEMVLFLKIFSIAIPFYLFFYFFLAIIQAFQRIKVHTFLIDFLDNLIPLALILLFIVMGLKTSAIIFSYALGFVIVSILSFLYCKYKISEVFKEYSLEEKSKKEVTKKLFSYSWPLILSNVLYMIFPYIDSFTIGYFKGAFQVGIYNAAMPIAALLILSPTLFTRLFFPMVTKEFSRNNLKMIRELSKQTEKWILIVNLPIFLLIFLFPGAIINILFGPEYISSTLTIFGKSYIASELALRFLAIGFLFYSLSVLLYNLLSMVGKTKLFLINIVSTSLLNLVLNILLIPQYDIAGAAFATMISQILLCIIVFFQAKKYTSIIPLRRKMLGIIFSGAVASILLFFIKGFFKINLKTIILLSSVFVLVYFVLILLTRSLDEKDIMIIKSMKLKYKNGK